MAAIRRSKQLRSPDFDSNEPILRCLLQQQQSNPNTNLVFGNSSMSSQIPATQHTQQQLVGIPLQQNHYHEAISAFHAPQYNLWTPIEPSTAARETPLAQQGLSLSLSNSQQQVNQMSFAGSLQSLHPPSSTISPSRSKDDGILVSGGTPSPASVISNGPVSGMRSILMSSKYLKATQQLLKEVVNVGSPTPTIDSVKRKDAGTIAKAAETSPENATGDGENGGGQKSAAELSTTERQTKKGKLVCILDEVEERYRRYHHQMQIVISSFEQAAGQGSASTFTAMALRTISKQFRCLKDAIRSQIRAVNKSLGNEDTSGKMGGSRLKNVDHHLRQQLRMVQHNNAWRPQRGLPERSVSVLRAWLFEHFLHPYPKDSEKHMLAKQTGLNRSQVSNWFINARVRLWKPMVEEMYNEEIKEQEHHCPADKTGNNAAHNGEDSASASNVATKENHNFSFKNASQEAYQNAGEKQDSVPLGRLRNQTTDFSPKRQRMNDEMMVLQHHPTGSGSSSSFQRVMEMNSRDEHVLVKFGIERQASGRGDYSLMAAGPANFIGGFGSYPMEDIEHFESNQYQARFSAGNGVSLTLGLTDTPQSFLPNQTSAEWSLARQLNSVP